MKHRHLAYADDMFLTALGDRDAICPESWKELFGMGSEPTDDPSRYPPVAEIRDKLAETRRQLREWFSGMTEEHFKEPMPEDWQGFAPNRGVLMSTIASHEGMHVGQMTVVRKSLGMPRAWG